jgi:hypothetical protein
MIHHLQTNILALEHASPGSSVAVDNDERMFHSKKLVPLDLKNNEKTKILI